MNTYTELNRKDDFDYFIANYQDLYQQYGHKFLAIRNRSVIGDYSSIPDAINDLSKLYPPGKYIIQECTGSETAYKTTIMRLMIGG